MPKINLGRKIPKTFDNPLGWEPLAEDFRISRPTILLLGGAGADTAAHANGYLKSFLLNLGVRINKDTGFGYELKDLPVDVIGAVYNNYVLASASLVKKLGENYCGLSYKIPFSDLNSKDIQCEAALCELYETYFKPLICNNEGKRLPMKDAARNVRNVNIVTHCMGSYVALFLESLMWQNMKTLGYTETEAAFIQKQLCIVNPSPVVMGFFKSTAISFVSSHDEAMWFETIQEERDAAYKRTYSDRVDAAMPNRVDIIKPNEGAVFVEKIFANRHGGADHEADAYLKQKSPLHERTAAGVLMSYAISSALGRAVNNSISNFEAAGGVYFKPIPNSSALLAGAKRMFETLLTPSAQVAPGALKKATAICRKHSVFGLKERLSVKSPDETALLIKFESNLDSYCLITEEIEKAKQKICAHKARVEELDSTKAESSEAVNLEGVKAFLSYLSERFEEIGQKETELKKSFSRRLEDVEADAIIIDNLDSLKFEYLKIQEETALCAEFCENYQKVYMPFKNDYEREKLQWSSRERFDQHYSKKYNEVKAKIFGHKL